MKKQFITTSLLACLLLLGGYATADDQELDHIQTDSPEMIYGSQMMTDQERMEHRERMRSAKTLEERELIRREHHETMKQRAEEQGLSIPDEPPAMGGGMGPRPGKGR